MTESFAEWVRLEQPRLGTTVVHATDDFFAAKERLIEPAEPVFIPDKYDDHGKWMDGWESRRRRGPGHDSCIIRLGMPGIVHGLDIDTSHFTGNHPPAASVEGCSSDADVPTDGWNMIHDEVVLEADSHHRLRVSFDRRVTHLRLNIFPDGGVARLRVYGEVAPDWSKLDKRQRIDLLALEHGGRALVCSDEHFGNMHNLNAPGRGVNMGDGWETARRRGPGNDWVVLALGRPGTIEEIEIDTAHFKGNYPDSAAIQAASIPPGGDTDLEAASAGWEMLLPASKLEPDTRHSYRTEIEPLGQVSHVRLSIFPDGGVSRLRLFGHIAGT